MTDLAHLPTELRLVDQHTKQIITLIFLILDAFCQVPLEILHPSQYTPLSAILGKLLTLRSSQSVKSLYSPSF